VAHLSGDIPVSAFPIMVEGFTPRAWHRMWNHIRRAFNCSGAHISFTSTPPSVTSFSRLRGFRILSMVS